MANASTVKKLLKHAVDVKFPYVLVLSGIHGIGKTQTVRDVAKDSGREYHYIRPGSKSDECELTGIPRFNPETHQFEKIAPHWLQRACSVPCIVFIDELNRTTDSMLDIVMQLGDSRSIDTFKLHPDTVVFGAINPVSTKNGKTYFVNESDAAMLDRFLVVKFENSVDNAISFYYENLNSMVEEKHMAFAQGVMELMIIGKDKVAISDDPKLPDKEWTLRGETQLMACASLINTVPEMELELVRACIGSQGAAVYSNREILRSVPTADEYFDAPDKYDIGNYDMVKSHVLCSRIVNSIPTEKSVPAKVKAGVNRALLALPDTQLTVFTRLLRGEKAKAFGKVVDNTNPEINKRFASVMKRVMEVTQALGK